METVEKIDHMIFQEKFIAQIKSIREVCQKVEMKLFALGFSPDVLNDVIVSIDEAITNIVTHGSHENVGDALEAEVEVIHDNGALHVKILDSGKPYDYDNIPMPDISENLKGNRIGGFGVFLMNSLMDHVHYRRDNETNVLLMSKKISITS